MNKTHLIALFIITINTIAYGQVQTDKAENLIQEQTEWKSLSEAEYEIKYPSDWDVNKNGLMGTTFMAFSPLSSESDDFKENVNLIIQDLQGYNMNLKQYVEISEDQIKTMITDGKILLNERKKRGEHEYQKLIYTGKQGVFDLKIEQLYWVINNKAYVLTLTCKDNEFDSYQETGEKILNSFEVK